MHSHDVLSLGSLARLLDVKGLLKLPDFSGRDEDFQSFYESFVNLLAAMDLDEIVEYVGRMSDPPSFTIMTPRQKQQAKLLYVLLSHVTQNAGRATKLVRQIKDRNGFWAWHSVCQEFRKTSADRLTAMHDGLLHPSWSLNWYEQWLD